MRCISRKILPLLLTLSLGLGPLQGVLAAMLDSPGEMATSAQSHCPPGGDGEMHTVGAQSTHDCDACDVTHGCSSGHCASCLAALLFSAHHALPLAEIGKLLPADEYYPGNPMASLFRPPRT